jgi:translation initiation factor IF-2
VTFLDTPGHEAFAAIREHGAHLTDLVVIVVAADDGIKPQTLEAIRFAKKAGVKMIVAANKIDKSEADINRLKQQLAEQNLLVEEWGGDLVVVPVSAKSGEGVNALLDMILLVTDLEELKAIDKGPANGLIIESHMEQGMGPVAVALVEKGRLKKGDFIVAGSSYAKARTIESTDGKSIADAGPSTPVIVSGFKSLPEFGDSFKVVSSEKEARNMTYEIAAQAHHDSKTVMSGNEFLRRISQKNEISEFNIVIRADVQGSLTSVIQSMQSINTEEVGSRVVGSGVGPINDNDIHLAKTANAVVYGFHTVLPAGIRQLASREGVSVRLYDVIYELLDDVKLELSKMLAPEVKEDIFSGLNIKKVFRTTKKELIVGGEVTNGKLEAPGMARIYRGKELIGEAEIEGLQRGQQEAKEIIEGELCGVSLKTNQKLEVLEGDKIEFFRRELIERSL